MGFKGVQLLGLVFLASCSSLKGSVLLSGIGGAALGSLAGNFLSPNKESSNANALVFGTLGAGLGSGLGYYFSKKEEEKKKLQNMILDDVSGKIPPSSFEISSTIQDIRPQINLKPFKRYEVPLEKLPERLKGKVKKQFILEYHNEEQRVQLGNRTFLIGPFKIWEHFYEE